MIGHSGFCRQPSRFLQGYHLVGEYWQIGRNWCSLRVVRETVTEVVGLVTPEISDTSASLLPEQVVVKAVFSCKKEASGPAIGAAQFRHGGEPGGVAGRPQENTARDHSPREPNPCV